ncbi:hypothetical protein NG798_00410 [Ancylothrix sp. C2]|uniref:hypothetical protein n=1 Tax=Ancylothrix sp. D3o TaxID=2953691 RepID=UPI0021BA863E|nr:hypothetical protein [Ancylothrix sp. D3o]MCT7948254.1 hypothetical protein [Ancylothrix sp. D3o]
MEFVTPEELLGGSEIIFDVAIPTDVLGANAKRELVVQLRPLTIGTFGLIMKAGKSDPALIPLLMIKESLVHPSLSLEQVKSMNLGLVNFLIAQIRQISGLTEKKMSSS